MEGRKTTVQNLKIIDVKRTAKLIQIQLEKHAISDTGVRHTDVFLNRFSINSALKRDKSLTPNPLYTSTPENATGTACNQQSERGYSH